MKAFGLAGLVESERGWLARHASLLAPRLPDPPPRFQHPAGGEGPGALLLSADGAPPAAAGAWRVVWQGRLDNRRELADSLGLGPRAGEGEVVAAALCRWGTEAPARLIGEFALAGYDTAERQLVLARDHMGTIGLFFHQAPGVFAFATHMRSLLDLPFIEGRLDEDALADDLLYNASVVDGTLWRGIDRVPTAGLAVFRPGAGVHKSRYWQPVPAQPIRFSRDEEYIEAARALLDQAVRDRLPAQGPVVCQLSGGLDSSAVAATAARLRPGQSVETLTQVPAPGAPLPLRPGTYGDERPSVDAIAALYPNMRPHVVGDQGPTLIEHDAGRLFQAVCAPMRNTHNAAWFEPCLRAATALEAAPLLTGSPGNLTLSWNGMGRLADDAAHGRWRALWRELNATGAEMRTTPVGLFMAEVARYRYPRLHRLYEGLRGRGGPRLQASPIAPEFARASGALERWQARASQMDPLYGRGDGPRRRAIILASERMWDHAAPWHGLFGVREAKPLVDRRLIEFCSAIPAEQHLREGQTRSFARRVLADRLPRAVLDNRLRGAQCPEWFQRLDARRGDLAETMHRLEASALARRCLDVPRLRQLFETWPADATAAQARWQDYHTVFGRGLHVGQFLLWVEAGRP